MSLLQLEWIDLRDLALEQLRRLGPCSIDSPQSDLVKWDDAVLRFRKLRESLTATHADVELRCQVYELSAVVCAAARNMAELLKCLQQLVNSIYPAVIRQQEQQQQYSQSAAAFSEAHLQQQQDGQIAAVDQVAAALRRLHLQQQQQQHSQSVAAEEATAALQGLHLHHHQQQQQQQQQQPDSSNMRNCSNWEAFLDQDIQHRTVEVAAALLLYFACVPRQPVKQELIKQIKQASKTVICRTYAVQLGRLQQQQQRYRTLGVQEEQPQNDRQQQQVCSTVSLQGEQQHQHHQQQQHACSTLDSQATKLQQQQQQQQQQRKMSNLLLLQHLTYQLAMRAAAAVLNCNWVQFWRCYNSISSSSSTAFLIKTVMEAHIQRLRVQVVQAAAAAYRMVPSDVLLRWLDLSPTAAAAAGSSAAASKTLLYTDPDQADGNRSRALVRDRMMRVLLAAAEAGNKGCRVAFDQCSSTDQAVLPDTIMFRS